MRTRVLRIHERIRGLGRLDQPAAALGCPHIHFGQDRHDRRFFYP